MEGPAFGTRLGKWQVCKKFTCGVFFLAKFGRFGNFGKFGRIFNSKKKFGVRKLGKVFFKLVHFPCKQFRKNINFFSKDVCVRRVESVTIASILVLVIPNIIIAFTTPVSSLVVCHHSFFLPPNTFP